ncbi:MAG: patatin-like phospholipase family protein [Usitatibacter sp.]
MAIFKAPEKFCDVVMKGGVTSGIVYPGAIVELSRHYCFQSIGGTSAGAIAAAATAAAEYRRRKHGSDAGYAQLASLPTDLMQTDGSGDTKLFRLFKPQPGTRPLFAMLEAALNQAELARLIRRVLVAGIGAFRLPVLIGALIAGAIALASTGPAMRGCVEHGGFAISCVLPLVAVAAFAAVGALVGLVIGVVLCILGPLVRNGFGLCRGFEQRDGAEDRDQLTSWLARLIDTMAGDRPHAGPLTFGDLWSADAAPSWLQHAGDRRWKAIDLQMITTNLTHGRPYRLPLHDEPQRLFFSPSELRDYFPADVVKWMVDRASAYRPKDGDPRELDKGLLQLPPSEDLPIVFAARLSLSFPFLIAAVPLHAIDYEPADIAKRAFRRCWFSDGGIASNFPIHFFDSPIPLWPTFAINLGPLLKDWPDERTYMPSSNNYGWGESWNRFGEENLERRQLAGFCSALLDSMREWRDLMQSRVPGYRDRIVQIRLKEEEGGLNLKMDATLLKMLAGFGTEAGTRLVDRFVHSRTEPGQKYPMDWDNHRWNRIRTYLSLSESHYPAIHQGYTVVPPGSASYAQLIECGSQRPDGQYPWQDSGDEPKALQVFQKIAEMNGLAEQHPPLRNRAPFPEPAVRIVPKV